MALRLRGLYRGAGWLRGIASRISRERGFTLLELMVAVLLLLLVTSGIVPFYLSTLAQASTVRYKSIATNIARERMEEIRQLDFREIDDADSLTARFGDTSTQRGISFNVEYAVDTEAYPDGLLKKVTVNVDWAGPPAPTVASVTTMIHQQYLGPRGAGLELSLYFPDSNPDPPTPFPLIVPNYTTIRYYIAETDWNLIFADLANPAASVRNVYARFRFYDQNSQTSINVGPAAADYKLGTGYLRYTTNELGEPTQVWFQWTLDVRTIPDGYWDLCAVAYNAYDQPGNMWKRRLRVEKGAPAVPTSFVAIPREDEETVGLYQAVDLYWVPGDERDRAYFVIQRRKEVAPGIYDDFVTLAAQLDPNASSFADVGSVVFAEDGSVASSTDPWGALDPSYPNKYDYRIWAVDTWRPVGELPSHVGSHVHASTNVPPGETTTTTTLVEESTTTSSTTTSSTTTTLNSYTVYIDNASNKSYTITIKNSSNVTVKTLTAAKNSILPVPGLPQGNYQITATTSGRVPLVQSFTLDAQRDSTVLQIL